MNDPIDPIAAGVTSAEALANTERMAAALRAAGWRVEPPASGAIRTGYGIGDAYRERLCQWVRDNGLDPGDIPADARIEIGKDTITTDVIVRDEDGKPMVSGNSVLRNRITVPLLKSWGEDPSAPA